MNMNVPVHQIMYTSDRDALPHPAPEEIRSRAGGDPCRMWSLDDARALITDVYGLKLLKADLASYCILHRISRIYIDLSVTDFLCFDVGEYESVGFRDPNSAKTGWKLANHVCYSTADSPFPQASVSECVANACRPR